jgi:ferritin-like metal-binding protein YciE
METAIVQIVEAHVAHAADQPLVSARLEEHLEQTRQHAMAIKGCIERLDHRASVVKAGVGSILGTLQAISTGILGDALLRNLLADYAAEKYEIGMYRALIAAASEMGDVETVEVCQRILREEEDMAGWIEEQLASVVHETLRQKTAAR